MVLEGAVCRGHRFLLLTLHSKGSSIFLLNFTRGLEVGWEGPGDLYSPDNPRSYNSCNHKWTSEHKWEDSICPDIYFGLFSCKKGLHEGGELIDEDRKGSFPGMHLSGSRYKQNSEYAKGRDSPCLGADDGEDGDSDNLYL